MMKIFFRIILLVVGMLSIINCSEKKKTQAPDKDVLQESGVLDSTIYGKCGENTAIHTLELITLQGDTTNYVLGVDIDIKVQGGLLIGDRLAVIAHKNEDGENIAETVINLTTLVGKWRSIDKLFEIQEDGTVLSTIKEENNPWSSWKIFNGKLVLSKDTFTINELGADSLYLENRYGIFAFRRQQ